MDTYVILRRNGWRTAGRPPGGGARSTAEGERMPDDIRWIRSYVLTSATARVGTVCIYEASSPEAIRDARRARRPAGRRDHRRRRHGDRAARPAAGGGP